MERDFNIKKILFIILSAGFVLRLIFIFTLKNKFYFDDEYEYFKMVQNFLEGKGLIIAENLKAFRPPLYPLFLSLLYSFGLNFSGIRIIQAIISTITIYFIYRIGKTVFSEKIGIFSAGISSIYPFFIFYTGFLLTETLFIFLVVLSIFYLVRIVDEDNSYFPFIGGIFLGLAGLCRPTMELFMPISIFLILSFRRSLKERIKKILILAISFIFVLSPWIIRNYKIFHKFIPGTTMGGWVFWEGNNPYSEGGPCRYFPKNILKIDEIKRDRLLYQKTIQVIKENPKRFLWLLKNKFLRFWNVVPNAAEFSTFLYRIISVLSFGILLPFFCIGFLISLKNKKANFMHFLIIFFTIFHMVFLSSIRYRVPIEPFYIIFAVYGFFYIILEVNRAWKIAEK